MKERALGQDVLESLNPGQQVVKIVSDELTDADGRQRAATSRSRSPAPTVILMAGLQGSGKTTAVGKLARHLREEQGMDVGVAACDVYRPAAVDQLIKVGPAGRARTSTSRARAATRWTSPSGRSTRRSRTGATR